MDQCPSSYSTVKISHEDTFTVRFLYNNPLGRVLLKLLVKPTISKIAGHVLSSPASRIFIRGFIKRNSIDMEEYKEVRYKSFNDFFVRELKSGLRSFPSDENVLAAPCDGKLTAYQITPDSVFDIKNSKYSIKELLADSEPVIEYKNGICLIFRLSPDDYHRYSYIDDGEVVSGKTIPGVLHTVRPISQKTHKVYSQNAREYSLIQTKNFGSIVQMEVGALFVGRITNNTEDRIVKRGDEKGMFQFGGSTVVLLLQKDRVEISAAVYENTRNGYETIVKMGSRIGASKTGS